MGAWIETEKLQKTNKVTFVAPRVGAWIETLVMRYLDTGEEKSHPVWVRGLKLIR